MPPPEFSGIFLDLEPDSLEDILAEPEDEIEALLSPGTVHKRERVRKAWAL